MNDFDYRKLKAVAESIRNDARNINEAIEMTHKAILYLAMLVYDEGDGKIYGTPDQYQHVFLDAAVKFSKFTEAQSPLKGDALSACTKTLADLYIKSSRDTMAGLGMMGEHLMQHADTIEGSSWLGLIHELNRRSG